MSAAAINEVPFRSGDTTIKMGREENSRAVISKDVRFHVWRIDHNSFVQVQ